MTDIPLKFNSEAFASTDNPIFMVSRLQICYNEYFSFVFLLSVSMVLFDMLMEIIKYIPGPDSDHKPLIQHSVGLHALENY